MRADTIHNKPVKRKFACEKQLCMDHGPFEKGKGPSLKDHSHEGNMAMKSKEEWK